MPLWDMSPAGVTKLPNKIMKLGNRVVSKVPKGITKVLELKKKVDTNRWTRPKLRKKP